MMIHPLERQVQKSGIALLRAMGWRVWRRNVSAFATVSNGKRRYIQNGEPGMSDTWGFLPDGRHFELEFKRHGEKLTAAQLTWLRSVNGPLSPAIWVDNTRTLQVVAEALQNGAIVRYGDGCEYDLEAAK